MGPAMVRSRPFRVPPLYPPAAVVGDSEVERVPGAR